jgi:hypothetical protein
MLLLAHVSILHWTMCLFLFVHMAISYLTTCLVIVVPLISFLLAHVSNIHWTMCHIFICLRVTFLFDHTWRCYSSMFCFLIQPRVASLLFHVTCTGSSTCHIFILPCGLSRFVHVLNYHFVTKIIWDHHKNNLRLSQLQIHYIIINEWLPNYSTWQSNSHNL